MERHQGCTHTEEVHVKTQRGGGRLQAKERPKKKSKLPTLWSWTSGLQNYGKIRLLCLNHPLYGILYGSPNKRIQTPSPTKKNSKRIINKTNRKQGNKKESGKVRVGMGCWRGGVWMWQEPRYSSQKSSINVQFSIVISQFVYIPKNFSFSNVICAYGYKIK